MTTKFSKRILYVDGQEDNHELIKLVLPEYDISCAHTLEDGSALIRSGGFSLYIFDLRLRDGTGMDLCTLIRAFDSTTPIIICSADVRDVVRQLALESGAQVFIPIPMDFDHFRAEVRRLVLL